MKIPVHPVTSISRPLSNAELDVITRFELHAYDCLQCRATDLRNLSDRATSCVGVILASEVRKRFRYHSDGFLYLVYYRGVPTRLEIPNHFRATAKLLISLSNRLSGGAIHTQELARHLQLSTIPRSLDRRIATQGSTLTYSYGATLDVNIGIPESSLSES